MASIGDINKGDRVSGEPSWRHLLVSGRGSRVGPHAISACRYGLP